MAKKIYAKCTNIEGDCKVALTGKVLDFPEGTSNEDLLCPECSESLFYPVKVGPDWGKIVRKAAIIALPIMIIGGGALWALLPSGKQENDNLSSEDSLIHNQGNGQQTVLPDSSNKGDNDSVKPATPAENTDPAPSATKPSSSGQIAYGLEVAGSLRVKDCDQLYQIWDGQGGKIDQIKRLSGCDCGTEHKFGDGYNYRIDCSGGTKRAVLVN